MSSERTRWSRNTSGQSPLAMSSASPSTIAVLPTPGSPMSTGLFFLRRARISMTRWISLARPIVGSSCPSAASWVRSRQKWSSAGVLDFFSPFGIDVCGAFPPCCPDALACGISVPRMRSVEIDASVGEHLRRDSLLLAEEAEEQVLGADVAVIELAGFAHRQLEDFL